MFIQMWVAAVGFPTLNGQALNMLLLLWGCAKCSSCFVDKALDFLGRPSMPQALRTLAQGLGTPVKVRV